MALRHVKAHVAICRRELFGRSLVGSVVPLSARVLMKVEGWQAEAREDRRPKESLVQVLRVELVALQVQELEWRMVLEAF